VLSCGTDAGAGSSPFSSSGGVITKTTAGDYLSLRYGDAADTQLIIENTTSTTIPTADAMQIDLSGNSTGIVTNGVDALYIKAEFGNGTANTNSLLHLDLDPVNSPSGDEYFYAINIDALSAGTSANERAIYVGANWDYVLDSDNVDISGAGVISGATGFTSSGTITFASLTSCSSLKTDGSGVLSCGGPQTKNTSGSGSVALSTTETSLTSLAITPASTSDEVLIIAKFTARSSTTSDRTTTLRIREGANCTAGQVGTDASSFSTNSSGDDYIDVFAIRIATPNTTSSTTYQLCALSSGTSITATYWDLTLMEINQGADYAELYNTNDTSVEQGDLVSLDPELSAGVKKSARAYESGLIGVVSTRPNSVIGGGDRTGATAVPIALSGRVPVKVSTENGPIAVGDLITSSSTPGVGMRATRAGYVIGRAMTAFNGNGEGVVIVFVNTHYADPTKLDYDGSLSRGSTSLEVEPLISLDKESNLVATISANAKFIWTNSLGKVVAWVSDVGEAFFEKITALVGDFGKIIFGELVAAKDSQVAGQASFEPNQTEVFIKSDKVTQDSLIYVTPTTKTDGLTLYIKEQKPQEGFTVGLERAMGDLPDEATASAKQTIKFNWLVINQE